MLVSNSIAGLPPLYNSGFTAISAQHVEIEVELSIESNDWADTIDVLRHG